MKPLAIRRHWRARGLPLLGEPFDILGIEEAAERSPESWQESLIIELKNARLADLQVASSFGRRKGVRHRGVNLLGVNMRESSAEPLGASRGSVEPMPWAAKQRGLRAGRGFLVLNRKTDKTDFFYSRDTMHFLANSGLSSSADAD